MQQLTDPYRALGVSRGATDAEIKAAHRKLVKRYHPDAGDPSETDRFLRVQEAYRVLSDPLLRKDWDLKHAPGPVRADRPAAPPRRRRPPPRPESEPSETSRRRDRPAQHPAARPTRIRARGRARRVHTRGPRRKCRGGKSLATAPDKKQARKTKAKPDEAEKAARLGAAPRSTSRTSTSTTARAARPGRPRRVPISVRARRTCRGADRSDNRARRW